MRAKVQKWGNSLAVRIPKSFAAEARFEQNTPVEMVMRDGELIIVPVRAAYTLEQLVEQITDENRHDEHDVGPAQGREEW